MLQFYVKTTCLNTYCELRFIIVVYIYTRENASSSFYGYCIVKHS